MIRFEFDRNSPVPLHTQIAKAIRHEIRSGSLKPGERLPTEEEMCQMYGFSRPVIRQAYKVLLEEGLIFRHQGQGTFVRKGELNYTLVQSILPLSQKIRLSGLNPSVKVLDRKILDYDPLTMAKLELERGDRVLSTRRVYFGDTEPLFYTEIYLPLKMFEGLEELADASSSLWSAIDSRYGIKPVNALRKIRAVVLSDEVANHLELPIGSAGFRIDTISFAQTGKPMELSIAYLKGIGTKISLDYFRAIEQTKEILF